MDPRAIAPRHICALLHGVETVAGEISWAERMEILCQNQTRTPIEFIARSYGGLLLNKTSALATLAWPPYRKKIVDREEEFFNLLARQEGRKRISVIAHSFGGYVVAELLKRGPVQIGETDAEAAVVEINRVKEATPESTTLH